MWIMSSYLHILGINKIPLKLNENKNDWSWAKFLRALIYLNSFNTNNIHKKKWHTYTSSFFFSTIYYIDSVVQIAFTRNLNLYQKPKKNLNNKFYRNILITEVVYFLDRIMYNTKRQKMCVFEWCTAMQNALWRLIFS